MPFDRQADYSSLLFARGYALADVEIDVPKHWLSRSFAGYSVRYDPTLPVVRSSGPMEQVLALGLLFDCRNPGLTPQECVDSLATALSDSEDVFLEQLDYLGGRFVLVYVRPDSRPFLMTDAIGMRSAFYCNQGARIVSSHAKLIAANLREHRQQASLPYKYGYPGRQTPWRDVFLLTPNTKLDLNSFKIERFWPRGEHGRQELDVQSAADKAGQLMHNALSHLARQHTVLLSITAGLDSRTSLALSRSFSGITYFTYYQDGTIGTEKVDRAFATTIEEDLGVPIKILRRGGNMPQGFRVILKNSTYYPHIPTMSYEYFENFSSTSNAVHVRSNASEIGRQYYAKRSNFRPVPLGSGVDMARIWYKKRKNRYRISRIFRVIDAFIEFDEQTGLTKVENFDRSALFYWEHRMGQWHSQVATESDPAFESTTLFNCRAILMAMLSVPLELQKSGAVHKEIIARFAPQLTQYPLNRGRPF